jgi:1-acyl-sn-glycerol-3-phosphate acyltransferase
LKVGSLIVYRLAVTSFDVMFRFTGGIQARHTERIPESGGLIVCPIHLSSLDPPALACTMRKRRLLAMAKEELWKNKLFGWVIKQIGAFPIRRGEGDREAIRYAQMLLEDGQALLMFPEGTRGDGTVLQPFASGPMMMAKKTGLPVIPIGISGTEKLFPKGTSRREKAKVTVVYGEAFTWAEVATAASEKENRALFVARLRRDIQALCVEGGLNVQDPQSSKLEPVSESQA